MAVPGGSTSEASSSTDTSKKKTGTDGAHQPADGQSDGGTSTRATASNQAFTPHDATALTAVRGNNGHAPELHPLEITGQPAAKTPPPEPKPTLSAEALESAAKQLHDQAHASAFLGVFGGNADMNVINNILEPLNSADRKALESVYQKQYGASLSTDLKDKLGANSENWSHVQAVLLRQDNTGDSSGQIRTALVQLDNAAQSQSDRHGILNSIVDVVVPAKGIVDTFNDAGDDHSRTAAEENIRKTLATMTGDQIKTLEQTYKQNYGVDLETALFNDKNISDATKAALKIYLQGTDHRSGTDAASVQNTLALAQVGLKYGNISIFDDAFANASPQARQAFLAQGGEAQIDKAFSGDDNTNAHTYVMRGETDIAMLVKGDHHWWHTNSSEITRLMSNASDQDRQLYARGQELSQKNQNPKEGTPDAQALQFYKDLHGALNDAGNSRQVAQWEGQLLQEPALLQQLTDSHNDGSWFFGMGAGTDDNKLYSAVENLNQDDWNKLKQHPENLQRIQDALHTFANTDETNTVMQMLRDKLAAPDFAASQAVGRRPLDMVLSENKDNPGNQLDAFMHMSKQDVAHYNSDENYRKQIDGYINDLPPGLAQTEAKRLIGEAVNGKAPDKIDAIAVAGVKADDPAQAVRSLEDALKADPTLHDRLVSPQTPEDKQVAELVKDALSDAFYKHDTGMQAPPKNDYIGYEEEAYLRQAGQEADSLLKAGRMPIDQLVQFDGDNKDKRFSDILNYSTPDEQKRLLSDSSADKDWANNVCGGDKEAELIRYAVKQGGQLDQADTFRAYVLGSGTTPQQLEGILNSMSADQKQDLANEYYTKYHQLISVDVVNKAPDSDKFMLRDLLTPTDLNVRQIDLDARVAQENHWSVMDGVLNQYWDKSGEGAVEAGNNMDKWLQQNAAELDNLPPEKKQQFLTAVHNYQAAMQNYVESKKQFAEMAVDAAIAVVAVGGAVLSGGASLSLLGCLAAGAGGAAFRVAAMDAIQGGDYDSSQIAPDAFKGFTAGFLSFLTPEALGLGGAVEGNVAATTADTVLSQATEKGISQAAFTGGEDAARQTLTQGLEQLTKQQALAAGPERDAAIQALVEKVAGTASTETQAELRGLIENQLQSNVTKSLSEKVMARLAVEAKQYVQNVGMVTAGNMSAEVGSTVLGFEDPKTLMQRLEGAAISSVAFGSIMHVGFKAVAEGYQGLSAALSRDAAGNISIEAGTIYRSADGSMHVADGKYTLGTKETIVEQVPENDPILEEQKTVLRDAADGRPAADGHRERLATEWGQLTPRQLDDSRLLTENDLRDFRIVTADPAAPGGVREQSVGEIFQDAVNQGILSKADYETVMNSNALVREHFTSLVGPDGKILPDQAAGWTHTMGEEARVLQAAGERLKALDSAGLSAADKQAQIAQIQEDTKLALVSSMFSDASKYTDTAVTKGNFHWHHLDGAVSATLHDLGLNPDELNVVVNAIRAHQVAPPDFMQMLYGLKGKVFTKAWLDDAALKPELDKLFTPEEQARLKVILNDPNDNPYKFIGDAMNRQPVRTADGGWALNLSSDEQLALRWAGLQRTADNKLVENLDKWYVPHNPENDPNFKDLSPTEQEHYRQLYDVTSLLLAGDNAQYATVDSLYKVVSIRGNNTFADKTIFDSLRSYVDSYKDASRLLDPVSRKLDDQQLALTTASYENPNGAIRQQMDDAIRKAFGTTDVPFYGKPLEAYPKGISPADQAKLDQIVARFDKPLSPELQSQLYDEAAKLWPGAEGDKLQMAHDYIDGMRVKRIGLRVLREQASMDPANVSDNFSSARSYEWQAKQPNGDTVIHVGDSTTVVHPDGTSDVTEFNPDGTVRQKLKLDREGEPIANTNPADGNGTNVPREVAVAPGDTRLITDGEHVITGGGGTVTVGGDSTHLQLNVPEGQTLRLVIRDGDPNITVDPASKGTIEVYSQNGRELPASLRDYARATADDPRVRVIEAQDLARPVGEIPNTEVRAFSPQEMAQVEQRIEATLRSQKETVSLDEWRGMFDKLPPEDRQIALEVMQQSSANMNSRAVDDSMRSLYQQMRAATKIGDKETVTVLTASNSSDGNALAHVFAKANGVDVNIKTLSPEEIAALQPKVEQLSRAQSDLQAAEARLADLKASRASGSDIGQAAKDVNALKQQLYGSKGNPSLAERLGLPKNVVVLDDLSTMSAEQRNVLGLLSQGSSVAVASDFSRGMNMYDMAVTGLTHDTTSMSAKLDDIVAQVKAIKEQNPGMTDQQAVDSYFKGAYQLDNSGPGLLRQTPVRSLDPSRDALRQDYTGDQMVDALYHDATRPLITQADMDNYLGQIAARYEAANAQRAAAGLEPLPGTAAEYQTAALRALETAHINDYPTMIDQMRTLDTAIKANLKQSGLGENDYLIVTGLEKDGSSYLVSTLYGKAAGVPSNRFISMAELQALENDPQKAAEILGGKRLVFLDDYRNSGRQQAELISNADRDVFSKLKSPDGKPLVSDVIVAALARHELPANAQDPFQQFGDGRLFHVQPHGTANGAPGQLNVYSLVGDNYVSMSDLDIQALRGLSPYSPYYSAMGVGSMYRQSSVATMIITPYGMPNNNPAFLSFAAGPLGLPIRYRAIDLFPSVNGQPGP